MARRLGWILPFNVDRDAALRNVTEDHLRRICPQVYLIDAAVPYPEIPAELTHGSHNFFRNWDERPFKEVVDDDRTKFVCTCRVSRCVTCAFRPFNFFVICDGIYRSLVTSIACRPCSECSPTAAIINSLRIISSIVTITHFSIEINVQTCPLGLKMRQAEENKNHNFTQITKGEISPLNFLLRYSPSFRYRR